ncbi:MAG: DNA helicase UvrD [Nevskiaceae bacterium]|nr:MAG: DNA helicase UvrD [Nevskiaceae bacterium]
MTKQTSTTESPAYRVNGHDATRVTFYALACDATRSVVVEACAGAGKTWMLVSRILRAMLLGVRPEEVLAITYTRKAAGEMRERLANLLSSFSVENSTHDERVKGLVERGVGRSEAEGMAETLGALYGRMLEGGRPVEIKTFHAWFAQLLRAAPRDLLEEIGLQPDVALIEEIDDVKQDVFHSFYEAMLKDADLHRDFRDVIHSRGRSQTMKWLEAALERRVEFELADGAGTLMSSVVSAQLQFPRFGAFTHPADVLASADVVETVEGLVAELAMSKNSTPQKAAAGLTSALSLSAAVDRMEAVKSALLTKSGTVKAHLKASALESFGEFLKELDEACEQARAHDEHIRMVRLSRALLSAYATYKRQRGLADMADLENCAQRLLGDSTLSGWVQEKLDSRIRQILIDEFQDTSPLQWRALSSWLSGYGGAGGGQHRPSVFIVGDPKQSIYRFRRAEPRVFQAAKDFVSDTLGGMVLECDHTRRNAPAILDGLNQVFAAATQEGQFAGFHAHTTEVLPDADLSGSGIYRLEPVMRDGAAKASAGKDAEQPWRDSLKTARLEAEVQLKSKEAERVAHAIADLLNTGMRPDDIMVLSRKRATLLLLQDRLRARGIPYLEAAQSRLADAAEVQDILAMMDVLVSSRHSLALARCLKSPMFNVGDDGLVWMARQARAAGLSWSGVLESTADEALDELGTCGAALLNAKRCLAVLGKAASGLPPHDLIDAILAETNYRANTAACVPDQMRSASMQAIDALLAVALEMNGGRFATPYAFVRELKAKSISHPGPAHSSAVQLLTVHGAKGLEAKVVFVCDAMPESNRRDGPSLLVDWEVDDPAPATCAFVISSARCAPSLRAVAAKEEGFRSREELNGLYVAMTRAAERLVLSCTEPHFIQREGRPWWDLVYPVATEWLLSDEGAAPAAAGVESQQVTTQELPDLTERAREASAVAVTLAAQAAVKAGHEEMVAIAAGRVLEWVCPTSLNANQAASDDAIEVLSLEACVAVGLRSNDASEVSGLVRKVRSTRPDLLVDGDWAWAANFVHVGHGRQSICVDRMVEINGPAGSEWWLLQYCLDAEDDIRGQNIGLAMSAVAKDNPGDKVFGVLIMADGTVDVREGKIRSAEVTERTLVEAPF